MKRIFSLSLALAAGIALAEAQTFKFDFTTGKTAAAGYQKVTSQSIYDGNSGYGYDFDTQWNGRSSEPFFFSVDVPDGNYRVTITLGSKRQAGSTTVRGESRRLYINNVATRKGEFIEKTFIVNKRTPEIADGKSVKIKKREETKLNWDSKLTLEINGDKPQVKSIAIERVDNVPTVYLCGNSTVVDNDQEPYTGWGQLFTSFFGDGVAIANNAESGLSANTFISGNRLEKIKSTLKAGDYVFVEFGHNDQKQKGAGKGAYYSFAYSIKQFIDEARAKGATPVLLTPTRRRHFDENGRVKDTHGDFPAAIREIAARENVALIDLQEMTRVLIETMGEKESAKMFVHYPANTYRNQPNELKDNTHFSTFGAYEIAKCVVEGVKKAGLPLAKLINSDYKEFSPAAPDSFDSFKWCLSPFVQVEKPDGN